MSRKLNFATIIATLTPKDSAVPPVQFQADTTMDEEDILSEPQPAKERGRRFMANDGVNSQVIQRYASNGKRDFSVFDSTVADQLIGWAQRNPTVYFDLDFQYQADEQDSTTIRKQIHSDCFIENTPARVINNEVATLKFTINYGRLQIQDADGNAL